MPKPKLPPLRAVLGEPLRQSLPEHLSNILAKVEDHGDYVIIKGSGPCNLGPSLVNDACPVASALRCKLGGLVVRSFRIENGHVFGKGLYDIENIATGMAVHEAYISLVSQLNRGWSIQYETYYETIVEHDGLELDIHYSPDILLGRNGQWYLVEIKLGNPQPSHEIQLALYYYLLSDYYNIKRAYLVTQAGILPYSANDLMPLVKQGLDYLASVKRVLDSWTGEEPGVVIRGSCPCKFAPACPVYKGITAFTTT